MSSTPWADQPYALVPTCKDIPAAASASSEAIFMADEMAHAHNAIIRILNSMYLQAPYVEQSSDIKDLLTYAKFWLQWVHHHHTVEEESFFPAIARISGRQDIMDGNLEQHHAFAEGMEAFHGYVEACVQGVRFEASRFRECIDGFGGELSSHLRDEIRTLIALDAYDIKAIRKEYDVFEAKLRAASFVSHAPLVFGGSDRAHDGVYESGENFPRAPGFVFYVIHYVLEWRYASVWRFNPSTTWGERRPLHFHA